MRFAAILLVAVGCTGAIASEPWPRTLTFEDRVAAQRAIEQIYWNHRSWPKENPEPKPPLTAVMSDDAVRAKVANYIKMSNALDTWWHRPISGEQLQAELDRMARGSRDPRILKELFDALHGDPFLIAETLARPALVERLARNWYATDPRIHGTTRLKAEKARASCQDVGSMKDMGGQYAVTTVKARGDDDAVRSDAIRDADESLDATEFKQRLDHLAAIMGKSPATVGRGQMSGVEEISDAFVVTAVLSRQDGEFVNATTTWSKQPFDAWWATERAKQSTNLVVALQPFKVPAVDASGCTNDTWASTHLEAPDMRSEHTAVWTGAEMIVWGGGVHYGGGYINTGGRYDPATDSWSATSLGANVPRGRSSHTAVWTGTEMIVWGGSSPNGGVFNDGGRYDPSTDSWAPMSVESNVPTARYAHSAVWTGTTMIVWGGFFGSVPTTPLATGGRYDPVANSWAATSIGPGVPAARGYHRAVWTGSEMIAWGGSGAYVNYNSGGRYDPVLDQWTPTSTGVGVPSANGGYTVVWTGTEMILWGSDGSFTPSGGRYNPTTDTWASIGHDANEPESRTNHTAVWTGTEMIIWGGYPFYVNGGRYNPATNTWSRPTTVGQPYTRQYHSAIWTGSEMIVWGGENCNGYCPGLSNSGGRYNPTTDSWVPTMAEVLVPGARQLHTALWTGTEMIVWGGMSGSSTQAILKTGGRYVAATDSWQPTSLGTNVPMARSGHSAVWTGAEMIIWGGVPGDPNPPYTINTGARYNPITDTWIPTSTGTDAPIARSRHTAVWTGTEMVVWGGAKYTCCANTFLNAGARYSPSTDHWVPTSVDANVPAARFAHRAVWTGAEMIIWGGYASNSSSSVLNTGGRYAPLTDSWAPVSTTGSVPAARVDFTAVWTGAEMVIWGGNTGSSSSRLNSGGRYDPSTDTWTPTSTGADVPAARYLHTASWTGREMIVWGGTTYVAPGYLNIGGRYDPSTDTWTPTSLTNVPPARAAHTAVWTGNEMIVWGGVPPYSSAGRYCACPAGELAYRDTDGDGYGDTGAAISSCDGTIPADYVTVGGDCNDLNPLLHPAAVETCNSLDDNCDGQIDEGGDELCDDDDFCTQDTCQGAPGCLNRFLDADEDGVCDAKDQCPATIVTPTVVIDSCDTGVRNCLVPVGCNFGDEIAACRANAKNHDQFVSCVAHAVEAWKNTGLITGQQGSRIVRCAAQ